MGNLKRTKLFFCTILLFCSFCSLSQNETKFTYGINTDMSIVLPHRFEKEQLSYYGNELDISLNYKHTEKWDFQFSLGFFTRINKNFFNLEDVTKRYYFYPIYLQTIYSFSKRFKVKLGLGYYYLTYRSDSNFDPTIFWQVRLESIKASVIRTDFILPTSFHYQFHKNLNVYTGFNFIHSKYNNYTDIEKNPRHVVHSVFKLGFEYTFKFKKERTGELD